MKPLPAFTRAAGLTLVELLIAMTLLATLTAGGLAAYAQAGAAWRTQSAAQRRLERAQFVFGTLEPDLQMAGYFGPTRAGALPAATVPPTVRQCGADLPVRLDRPLERLTSLPVSCVARATLAAGSDVLVVRRASARTTALRTGRAQWAVWGNHGFEGTLLWDGVAPPAAIDPEVRDLVLRIYYVSRSADGDATTPALRVKTLTEIAGEPAFIDTEVMPGVESLAVEPSPGASPRTVRIGLRVRADAADTDHPDAHRTLSVTRQFTLRNAPATAG